MEAQTGVTADSSNGKQFLDAAHDSVVMEIELDEEGIIRNCNGICEDLVGFSKEELISRPISLLVRKLAEYQIVLNHNLNPVLDYICHCGMPFQMKTKAGETFFSQIKFVYLRHLKIPTVRLLATPMAPGYQGPAMMS